MNGRTRAGLIVGGLALAVAGITGCSTTSAGTSPEAPRTIAISATGQADVAPDAARAQLSVVGTDPASAQKAQEQAATAADALRSALSAAGVADDDIATTGISVGPTYVYPRDGEQQISGYQATQSFSVTLRDLTTAGATLDSAIAAAGNAARIDGVATFVTDPAAGTQKAREQAVEIARAQAEQYAQLLGFTLGPVASVSESGGASVAPVPMAMEDSAGSSAKAPTTIDPGTTQVSVTLDVAWLIQ